MNINTPLQTFDLFLDDRRPGAIKIQDGLSGTSPVCVGVFEQPYGRVCLIFCRVTEHAQGGRELKDTPRPMLATNLISAMKRTCKALNLPQTGFHAFRRNFAQEVENFLLKMAL